MTKTERSRPRPAHNLFKPPGWQHAQAGDIAWWIREGWRDAILGPHGLRLDEWREDGRLEVVKAGSQRVVYRAELPQGAVYVKHFLVPNFATKLRQWVRLGKAHNEAQRTTYLAAIGISTITPLALGEQRSWNFVLENYLVTHAIPEAYALDDFIERRLPEWPEHEHAQARQKLAKSLGDLTARLHEAGIFHVDFHPGNLLVQMEPDGQPRLTMIDLDGLRASRPLPQFWEDFFRIIGIRFDSRTLSRPLSPAESQHNLARLNHYFWLRSNRADRQRFVQAYLHTRRALPDDSRAFARGIEAETRAWAERMWRRWGRRCWGTNKYFKLHRGKRARVLASRELDSQPIRALLDDPETTFASPQARVLENTPARRTVETALEIGGRRTRVVYHRFTCRTPAEKLARVLGSSPACRAWQGAQHLVSRAIGGPKALALVQAKHASYLLLLKDERAVPLEQYLRRVHSTCSPEARAERVRRLTQSLAQFVRTMHDRSVAHQALDASTLLIAFDDESDAPRLSVTEAAGTRLLHPMPASQRLVELARLQRSLAAAGGFTRTDALRFLRTYLPWGLSAHNDWKALWRSLAKATKPATPQAQQPAREALAGVG